MTISSSDNITDVLIENKSIWEQSNNTCIKFNASDGQTLKVTISKKPEKKEDKDKEDNPTDPLLPSDDKTNG